MLRIKILLVGKVREKYLQQGQQEYLKRLGPYARVELIQLPDEPIPDRASPAQEEQVREREAERVLRALDPGQYVIALDVQGTAMSSEAFSAFLAERALRGQSSLAFVIGGSTGLAPAVLQRADYRLSLGPMTYLHQMVPLLLLEQLYRGFKIAAGDPYHK